MLLLDNEQISIILEEYRALYSLLTYRFSSIEKRVATAGMLVSDTSSETLYSIDVAPDNRITR